MNEKKKNDKIKCLRNLNGWLITKKKSFCIYRRAGAPERRVSMIIFYYFLTFFLDVLIYVYIL